MQCKQSICKLKQNEVFCIMEKMTYNQTVKEAIAIALVQLMKSKNFEDISVSEIVKIAGVGRSSFYRNFEGKKDVLSYYIHNLYNNFFKDSTIMSHMPKENNVHAFLLPRFKFIKQHRDFFTVLRNHDLLYYIFEQTETGLILQLTGLQNNLSQYYRAMFSGSCAGIIRMWIDNNFAQSEEEMVEIFTHFPQG